MLEGRRALSSGAIRHNPVVGMMPQVMRAKVRNSRSATRRCKPLLDIYYAPSRLIGEDPRCGGTILRAKTRSGYESVTRLLIYWDCLSTFALVVVGFEVDDALM
jgi:hypothetical protein